MMKAKWGHDLQAERVMSELGIKWKIKTIPMSAINEEKSLYNKARLSEPIKSEVVEDYAYKMKIGEVFGSPVTVPLSRAEFQNLGGNHRYAAAKKLGDDEITVYIVEYDRLLEHEIFDVLPTLLNRENSLYLPREELIQKVVHEVATKVMTVQEAAKTYKISTDTIRTAFKADELRAFLDANGVKVNKIGKTVLRTLASIDLESIKIAAGRVATEAGMTGEQADVLVKELKKSNQSEAAQMIVIRKYEGLAEELMKKNKGQPMPAPQARPMRAKFLAWLTTGEHYLRNVKKLSQLPVRPGDEKEAVVLRITSVIKKLHVLSRS